MERGGGRRRVLEIVSPVEYLVFLCFCVGLPALIVMVHLCRCHMVKLLFGALALTRGKERKRIGFSRFHFWSRVIDNPQLSFLALP